jgi:hypothetical protein
VIDAIDRSAELGSVTQYGLRRRIVIGVPRNEPAVSQA